MEADPVSHQNESDAISELNQNSGCLGFLLKLFFGGGSQTPADEVIPEDQLLPYRIRDDFLSNAELSFYQALILAVPENLIVCPKVNLGDLFHVSTNEQRTKYWNQINRKHVDFLVCDRQSMKPVLGVELDDSSHQRADRIKRDDFVDRVFAAACLPLLRQVAQKGYQIDRLRDELTQCLCSSFAAIAAPQVANEPNGSVPQCPKCQIPMVKRIAKKGPSAGRQFYGCQNYPRCKETVIPR